MTESFVNAGYAYACRIENAKQAAIGSLVLSGCTVSAQGTPAMAVDIAAGEVVFGNKRYTISGTSKSVDASDSTDDRYDIIYIDSSGVVQYADGNPDNNPYPPDLPAGSILLAILFVENASTTVEAGDVADARIISLVQGPQVMFSKNDAGLTIIGNDTYQSVFDEFTANDWKSGDGFRIMLKIYQTHSVGTNDLPWKLTMGTSTIANIIPERNWVNAHANKIILAQGVAHYTDSQLGFSFARELTLDVEDGSFAAFNPDSHELALQVYVPTGNTVVFKYSVTVEKIPTGVNS